MCISFLGCRIQVESAESKLALRSRTNSQSKGTRNISPPFRELKSKNGVSENRKPNSSSANGNKRFMSPAPLSTTDMRPKSVSYFCVYILHDFEPLTPNAPLPRYSKMKVKSWRHAISWNQIQEAGDMPTLQIGFNFNFLNPQLQLHRR